MIKRCYIVGLCLFITAQARGFACELYQPSQTHLATNGQVDANRPDSVLFHSPQGVCFSLVDGLDYNPNKAQKADALLDEGEDTSSKGYWSDWILNTESNPVITQTLASSYFGIGVWMPSDLESNFDFDHAEDWIRNHGLQFSLGFGDRRPGEPRMRIDYRWHEIYDGDVMMQIELPF